MARPGKKPRDPKPTDPRPVVPTPPASEGSARAVIAAFLDQYGLGELGDWAWDLYTGADGGPGLSMEEIGLLLPQQPLFQQRFPAYAELAARGQAITPTAYIEYERRTKQLLQQFGIPSGMYDTPQGIANLLLNDVSTEEIGQRLNLAADAAYRAPIEVRQALAARGIDPNQLTAYYLDPDKALPLIEQQYISAQVSGAAAAQNVAVDIATADRLASQGYGYDEARQGFGQVKALEDLSNATFTEAGVSYEQLIGSQFGDAQAQVAARKAVDRRAAEFQAN